MWKTRPISPVCEQFIAENTQCGELSFYAYPAYGGGWMALCRFHGTKHLPHCSSVETLLNSGETLDAAPSGSVSDDSRKLSEIRDALIIVNGKMTSGSLLTFDALKFITAVEHILKPETHFPNESGFK